MHLASKTLVVGLICAASAGAADMKKAARDWKSKCASCHGADGKGHTDQGKKMKLADLSSASWQKANTDAKIKGVIENGAKNGDAQMDGYKDKLSAEQIDALVSYVRSLKASSKAAKKKAAAL